LISLSRSSQFDPISVRYGDDLAMVSRSYSFQQGFDLEKGNEIYKTLVKTIPHHNSINWVNRRKSHSNQLSPSKQGEQMDKISAARQHYASTNLCQLTVAIATSGDLNLFSNIVNKFPDTDLLCEVIVLSPSDYPLDARAKMMNAFPQFTFVFKSDAEAGVAQSLNMATKLTKSRYFMFISDGWENIDGSSDEHLRQALTILKGDPNESIAQVIFNDQTSSQCALGIADLSGCNGSGGWKRVINGSTEFRENE
jgi:hypothetical protein